MQPSRNIAARLLRLVRYAAMCPVWLLQLPSGYKSFRDNPILGSRRLNALGLHAARQQLAHAAAARRRRRLRRSVPEPYAEAFDRDGFVIIRDVLPQAEFTQLREEVRRYRGAVRETVQGDTVTRHAALDPHALREMPSVRRLLRAPLWRGLLHYAGGRDAEPLCYVQTILTKRRAGPPDPQTELHSDTFHPTVKAWFTLTDVAADGAPFTYVPGSHRITFGRAAWEKRKSQGARDDPHHLTGRGSFRVHPHELAEMGYPPPAALAVPANCLIVADTCGFHARGPSAAPVVRVELWASGRSNPFFTLPFGIWRMPALAQRRAPLAWWIGDRVESLGGKKQVWRRRENVSAFDTDTGPNG